MGVLGELRMDSGMMQLLEYWRGRRPRTRKELASYVKAFLGLRIPDQSLCEGHDSPMDYLEYALLDVEGGQGSYVNRDCVVWANRGGGKTQLGAIASLLECWFLPGCQVRILGGSEEQSQRMYEYLRGALLRGFEEQVVGQVTARGCGFANGAAVQVLAQSHRSVRGHHVQRLRCDEVDMFDREVWQAAQFVTQSKDEVAARLEVFSTMHRPYGLMNDILREARQGGRRIFKWCLWEVIERCGGRNCTRCALWSDCGGRAKNGRGYYRIEDAIAQKQRSSEQAWKSEMLCERPNLSDAVFAEFDAKVHVREIAADRNLPTYRAIDFGFSNPLVCLFIQVDGEGRVLVFDEYLKSRTTLAEHVRLIKEHWGGAVEATYCDPAGRARNEITGTSAVTELAALGVETCSRQSKINDGVELVRRFLAPAAGGTRLLVSPRCENLIRAFGGLHYQREAGGGLSEVPHKDGVHDHPIDALRYFFVNHFGRSYRLEELKY